MKTGKIKTVLVTIVVTILTAAILGLMGTVVYYKAKNSSVEDENSSFFGSNPWSAECNAGDMEYDIENAELDYIVTYHYSEKYSGTYNCDITITADVYVTSYQLHGNYYNRINESKSIGKIENKLMGYREPADDYLYYDMKITIPKETFAFNYGAINIFYDGYMIKESNLQGNEANANINNPNYDRNFRESINGGSRLFYKTDGKTVRFSDMEFGTGETIRFSEMINNPMSMGYERQTNYRGSTVDFLEISADKLVFEKNDVKVNLSFGRLFDEAWEENSTVYLALYSDAILYREDSIFNRKDIQESTCISRKIENYIPEKYACERILDENRYTSGIRFSHEETLILPEELFAGDARYLYVRLYAEDPKVNPVAKLLAEMKLKCYKCDGQVYLS